VTNIDTNTYIGLKRHANPRRISHIPFEAYIMDNRFYVSHEKLFVRVHNMTLSLICKQDGSLRSPHPDLEIPLRSLSKLKMYKDSYLMRNKVRIMTVDRITIQLPRERPQQLSHPQSLQLASINVSTLNDKFSSIQDHLVRTVNHPNDRLDVVTFQETLLAEEPALRKELTDLYETFSVKHKKFSQTVTRKDPTYKHHVRGLVTLSHKSLRPVLVEDYTCRDPGTHLTIRIEHLNRNYFVVNVYNPPGQRKFAGIARIRDLVSKIRQENPDATIMTVGDFNLTSKSLHDYLISLSNTCIRIT
jgi:hypothetical protein